MSESEQEGSSMNPNHVYDMIIVGGGPGGYTSALYAARAGIRHGAIKRILQKAETVLVNIDILEDVLQYRSQHISGVKQLVHTR